MFLSSSRQMHRPEKNQNPYLRTKQPKKKILNVVCFVCRQLQTKKCIKTNQNGKCKTNTDQILQTLTCSENNLTMNDRNGINFVMREKNKEARRRKEKTNENVNVFGENA
jgi:hypothetical protein